MNSFGSAADECAGRGAVPPQRTGGRAGANRGVLCGRRKVLHQLLEREHGAAALPLSTCNRVEVYGVVQLFMVKVIRVADDGWI